MVMKTKTDLIQVQARRMESVRDGPTTLWWLLNVIVTIVIFLLVLQTNFVLVGSHSHSHENGNHDHHDHGHSHEEPPAFKYSREANVEIPQQEDSKTVNDASNEKKPVHMNDKLPFNRNPNLWFDAIASTLFISAAPFFILFLIPLDNSNEKKTFLKVLLSFASGGLLGDAFLHLIPHAILAKGDGGHGHSHSHSHSHSNEGQNNAEDFHGHDLSVGIWVLVGIITFLIVEKLIRIIKGKGHSAHSHSTPSVTSDESEHESKNESKGIINKKQTNSASKTNKSKGKKEKSKTSDTKKKCENEDGEIQVAGYLNLAADFTHNFTDGLAIGASYLAGRSVGLVTTFTILLHEVPHEIGDFAILIQSGCSKKKAIMLQLITALGALSGTVMSLLAEGIGESATTWILPFTAGGFIYIATVSVIPELLHDSKFKQSVLEIIALLGGVYMMVLISKYE